MGNGLSGADGRPRAGRGLPVAPRILDPVLGLVEQLDRRRRRIRPLRSDGLLGVERRRHGGAALTLADGTSIRRGDPLWVLHFDNRRLRRLADYGWPTRAYAAARDDLRVASGLVSRTGPEARPVALTGVTLLAPLSRRVGFEVRPRPSGWRTRLEEWYLRSLLARWSPGGRARLRRGHGSLAGGETWMSTDELLRLYAPPPE